MRRNPKSGSRRINSPFPKQPAGLGFVKGEVLFDPASTPSQSHTAGQGFEVRWQAEAGRGTLQVYHTTEPERVLWSTIPGRSFLSAAFGTDSFEESRGSFAIHDKIDILCSHQTVEQVTLAWPSETFGASNYPALNSNGFGHHYDKRHAFRAYQSRAPVDADGVRVGNRGPCVIVTGCLYSDPKLARAQFAAFAQASRSNVRVSSSNSPFYFSPDCQTLESRGCLRLLSQEQRVGVRYRLVFYECRDHQLGFFVSLEQPASFDSFLMTNAYVAKAKTKVSAVVPLSAFDVVERQVGLGRSLSNYFDGPRGESRRLLPSPEKKHWLWSEAPVSAFSRVAAVGDGGVEAHSSKGSVRRSISVADFRTYSLFDKCVKTGNSSFLSELASSGILAPEDQLNQMQLPRLNRIQLTYSSNGGERFFGFGEQFSHFDMKGKKVPIFVQEQGLGRGDQPVTALANMVSNSY